MHPYGIDTEERRNVIIVLIVASYVLTTFLARWHWLVAMIPPEILDWVFDPLSASALFFTLFWIFDRWAWKLTSVAGLTHIPDLNGIWQGGLRSSYDEFRETHPIDLEIKQTWSRIVVELRTGRSGSISKTASIYLSAGVSPDIVYTYVNTPKADQPSSLETHPGTTELRLSRDKNQLVGTYYTGRGRRNYGEMAVTRVPDQKA